MWGLISFAVSAYGVYRLAQRWVARGRDSSALQLLRELRGIDSTPIADVREGQALKVAGKVRLLGAPLTTPHEAAPCAVYRAEAHGQRDGSGAELVKLEERSDFLVEDESGQLLVRVAGAKLLLYPTCLRQTGDSRLKDFFALHKSELPDDFLYVESALREGEFVQVMGRARSEADPAAQQNYREPAQRLSLAASPDSPLIISSYSPHTVKLFQLPDRALDQGALDAAIGR